MDIDELLMNWPHAMRIKNEEIEDENFDWLNARISETQQLIACQKWDLAESENKGLNAGISCRNIAAMTEHLNSLKVRRAALLRDEGHECQI